MDNQLLRILYPPKCVLCGKLLGKDETDLCHHCRENAPACPKGKFKISFVARWTALWYYKENVRESLLRYKFWRKRHYGVVYGRLLAMKLLTEGISFDLLTWIPISARRRRQRGYDQSELLADFVGKELSVTPQALLRKHRHNLPQATLGDAPQRRANVLGAYRCTAPEVVRGKTVLLIDDVLTTGATAGECARVLLTAGAKAVICATVAAANHQHK